MFSSQRLINQQYHKSGTPPRHATRTPRLVGARPSPCQLPPTSRGLHPGTQPGLPDLSGPGRLPVSFPRQVVDSYTHATRTPRLVGARPTHLQACPDKSGTLPGTQPGLPDSSGPGRHTCKPAPTSRGLLHARNLNCPTRRGQAVSLPASPDKSGTPTRTQPGLPDLSGQCRPPASLPRQVGDSYTHATRTPPWPVRPGRATCRGQADAQREGMQLTS